MLWISRWRLVIRLCRYWKRSKQGSAYLYLKLRRLIGSISKLRERSGGFALSFQTVELEESLAFT